MKLSIYALLAGAVFVASPAAAQQDEYMQQVVAQLEAVAEAMGEEGIELAGEPQGGTLDDGESAEAEFEIEPGTYLIVGACDTDCSDLDIVVLAGGRVIASDVETDDSPVVAIEVDRNTTITVRVSMAACSSEPCRYGVAAFSN